MSPPSKAGDRLLHYLGKDLSWGYSTLFSASDALKAQERASALDAAVQASWKCLFLLHPGVIAAEPGPEGKAYFDYAMCTVTFSDLKCRVIQGRGETRVQLSHAHSPDNWHELTTILLELTGQSPQDLVQLSLITLQDVLLHFWDQLKQFLIAR